MEDSKSGRNWSKKARYSSREVSADGCHRERVTVTEEDLARFFVLEKLDISFFKGRLLIFYGYHMYVAAVMRSKLVSNGGR